MSQPLPIDVLLKKCPSVYGLVLAASRRAKEVAEGAPRLIDTDARKATTIALQEIVQDKVLVKHGDQDESGGKRRSKGKKEEKKA